MYLKDFLTGLRRRWYLALVGVLLTGGLGFAAINVVPPAYTSTTSMLMLPPQLALGPRGNPYLNLSGLGQALEVLTTRVNASSTVERITRDHPDVDITVGPDTTSTGPILLISVTASEGSEATAVRDELSGLTPGVLVAMQNELNIVPNSRITIATLASDPEPEKSLKDQLRALIAVVAIGLTATVLITGYLDYILARRRRRSDGVLGTAESVPADPGVARRGDHSAPASTEPTRAQPAGSPVASAKSQPRRPDPGPQESTPVDSAPAEASVAEPSWWDDGGIADESATSTTGSGTRRENP